jgi:hypothetical protein
MGWKSKRDCWTHWPTWCGRGLPSVAAELVKVMTMDQAQHLMGVGHDAVEEATKTLREIVGVNAQQH